MAASEVLYGVEASLYPEESYYAVVEVCIERATGERTHRVLAWHASFDRACREMEALRAEAERRAA